MCKACKSECPLGVDMATLKSEALAHHHEQHGTPLRSRVFGAIRTLNRLGSATAPLSNLPGRCPPCAAADGAHRGDRARSDRCRCSSAATCCAGSTPLAEHLGGRWRPGRSGDLPGRLVHHASPRPRIGRAAIELLRGGGLARSGWRAAGAADGPACPRAWSTTPSRRPAGSRSGSPTDTEPGSPIVGCEPSCLFTLRDEHRSLLPDDPHVRDVGGRVRQVEELLTDGDRRRPAGAARGLLAGRAAGAVPRPLPPEGRGRHRRHGRAAAPDPRRSRSSRSTPAAAGWPGRSASRPSTTTCR